MPKPTAQGAAPTFEDAMKRLESIVAEMESGELPLESLIARHEEGVRLVAVCTEKLDAARKRIEVVEENGGSVTTVPFSESEGAGQVTGGGETEFTPKGKRRQTEQTPAADDNDDDASSLF